MNRVQLALNRKLVSKLMNCRLYYKQCSRQAAYLGNLEQRNSINVFAYEEVSKALRTFSLKNATFLIESKKAQSS